MVICPHASDSHVARSTQLTTMEENEKRTKKRDRGSDRGGPRDWAEPVTSVRFVVAFGHPVSQNKWLLCFHGREIRKPSCPAGIVRLGSCHKIDNYNMIIYLLWRRPAVPVGWHLGHFVWPSIPEYHQFELKGAKAMLGILFNASQSRCFHRFNTSQSRCSHRFQARVKHDASIDSIRINHDALIDSKHESSTMLPSIRFRGQWRRTERACLTAKLVTGMRKPF